MSRDIRGNETVSRAYLDRAAKTQTRTVDTPDSDQNQTVETRFGLTVSSTSATGVTHAFVYDALGRRVRTTDPRTGDSLTHYNALGRVDYVEDAAGNRTRFEYEPATGRKSAQIDAQGRATRWEYDAAGRVIREWGATYPVSYDYDEYGRKVRMSTYRAGSGWFAATWPAGNEGDSDDTHWVYDEPTGLLTHKVYDDGHGPAYVYTPDGRLETRAWARADENNAPLVTTYSYSAATGDLALVDYSDATPDVVFAYDRLGRKTRVTDAAGLREFAYDETLALHSESQSGLYTTTLIRGRDTLGREAGFTTGDQYAVNYAYDPKGRQNQVSGNVDGMSTQTTYTYVPNSDLLAGMSSVRTDIPGATPVSTTYTYEPHRDLKTMVRNHIGDRVISQYDYVYNAIGFRQSVVNNGEAFTQSGFNLYNYNDRGELTESSRYQGEDVADTTNPVEPEYRNYQYDSIGNRQEAVDWDKPSNQRETIDYDTNGLNQYTQTDVSETGETATFTYDLDGNMTSVSDSHGVTLYTWNAENQLIAVEKQNPQIGDLRVTFMYDYMGRRVQKKVYRYDSGAWVEDKGTLFAWDGWNMFEENIKQAGTERVKHYVWGLDLSQTLQGAGGVAGCH